MRLPASLLPALLAALLATGCDKPSAPEPPQPPEPPPLTLVVHPYDTPSEILSRFEPLAQHLSAAARRPVSVQVALSYGEQVRRIAGGDADLAYLGPAPYLRAVRLLPSRADTLPILAAERSGEGNDYRSVLVTRDDSGMEGVEDLRGRTVAFGSPRSFSSHFVPRVMLLRYGIDLAALRDFAYLDRHERVALAVLHGDFDAGGVRRAVAARYLDQGLRILETSPNLTPHVVAASPAMPGNFRAVLTEALHQVGRPAGPAFHPFGPTVRFGPPDPAAFTLAQQVVDAVERQCDNGPLW